MSTPVTDDAAEWTVLGRVSGLFGVRGWVKVFSHTSPKENILSYKTWYLKDADGWHPFELDQGRIHGKGIVAALKGVADRDQAAGLLEAEIAIPRDQLPQTAQDEYYWADLEGLRVINLDGVELGRVDYLFETGANDVMVVKGRKQRLLPFIGQVVAGVDLAAGVITVDWDPEF